MDDGGGGANGTLPTSQDWLYPGKGPCVLIGEGCLKGRDESVQSFFRLLLLFTISPISSESLRLFCSSTTDEMDAFVSQDADAEMP